MQVKINVDNGTVGQNECFELCEKISDLMSEEAIYHIELRFVNANEGIIRELLDWYLEHQDICLQFHINSEEE